MTRKPMDFIAMDPTGPFEIVREGNQYALSIICMFIPSWQDSR